MKDFHEGVLCFEWSTVVSFALAYICGDNFFMVAGTIKTDFIRVNQEKFQIETNNWNILKNGGGLLITFSILAIII